MQIARRLSGKVIIINNVRIKWEGTMPELESMAGENEKIPWHKPEGAGKNKRGKPVVHSTSGKGNLNN